MTASSSPRMPGRHRASSLVALAAFAALAAPASALAQPHVIGPGHEAAVLALVAPHALGTEVADGFALWDVSIESSRIAITVRRADGVEARVFLQHPDDSPSDAPTSASFAIVPAPDAPAEARRALEQLEAAVRANDGGEFWGTAGSTADLGSGSGGHETRRAALWGDADWVPIDGLAVILLVLVLGVLLSARLLADAPRWMAGALAGIVVSGLIVRVLLAPPTFLGAWPWTRLYPHVRAVAQGHWLAAVARAAGETFYVTDVALSTNFAYAALMPLVLFAHATYLLRDPRAGLWASFAVAFLPQHVRFSRCEDGFVGSLVLTSLAFALVHGWLRDPSRVVRGLLLVALPFVLYPGYLLRPLNILFIGVYVVALVALHGESAPRWRRVLGIVVVVAVGAAALVQFIGRNAETVASSVRPALLESVVEVVLSPRLLVLSDPTRTPPALIALAIAGGTIAWRAGERRLVAFLAGWLALFVVAHAVVVQESMQPRYHLHLVVPFLLLGALAVAHGKAEWLRDRRRRTIAGVALASIALAPWLHGTFVGDVGYTELGEYAFVRDARDVVPEDCTVLEYVGGEPGVMGAGSRFERIGELASPHRELRFDVVPVYAGGRTSEDDPSLEVLAASPPACLYVYDGLACSIARDAEHHACAALRDRFGAETVREASLPVRLYDEASDPNHALAGADEIVIRLSRVAR